MTADMALVHILHVHKKIWNVQNIHVIFMEVIQNCSTSMKSGVGMRMAV